MILESDIFYFIHKVFDWIMIFGGIFFLIYFIYEEKMESYNGRKKRLAGWSILLVFLCVFGGLYLSDIFNKKANSAYFEESGEHKMYSCGEFIKYYWGGKSPTSKQALTQADIESERHKYAKYFIKLDHGLLLSSRVQKITQSTDLVNLKSGDRVCVEYISLPKNFEKTEFVYVTQFIYKSKIEVQ